MIDPLHLAQLVYIVAAVCFSNYIYDENAKVASILSGLLWPLVVILGIVLIHTDPLTKAAWEDFKAARRGD